MSSASPEGSLTRANPPPPIELINGSVTPTAAAAATAASAAVPPARYVSAAAAAAYGVPAAAAKVRFEPVVSITGYYAPSLARRAANGRKQSMHPLPTWVVVSARTPSPATSVSDRLLFAPLTLSGRLGSHPQREVDRLHRLPHYFHQIIAQGLEVCFVPELGREGFQSLPGIVLAAVEAAVYKGLDAPSQGSEQRRYHQGGCHHREGGLPSREGYEEPLQNDDAAEVHQRQHER